MCFKFKIFLASVLSANNFTMPKKQWISNSREVTLLLSVV